MTLGCPICDLPLPAPAGAHGSLGQALHSKRKCPRCSTALAFFADGPDASREVLAGWCVDRAEMARRRQAARFRRAA